MNLQNLHDVSRADFESHSAVSPQHPPPPPPPPPPLNPWQNRALDPQPSLLPESIWPYRLLHVDSMTSYVRQEGNIYHNVVEPAYNVLSYTWGYYEDKSEAAILVHGINWPIPGIEKTHFQVHTFHKAIIAAAKGVKHKCEWLWVDIACIPQKHKDETEQAEFIRGQEIGRQVAIFNRAKEAFAWLSSLRTTDLLEKDASLVTIEDLCKHTNLAYRKFEKAELAMDFLETLEKKTHSLGKWMTRLLSHRWFLSLWTLQEMILRSDALILFDDGFLDMDAPYNSGKRFQSPHPWSILRIKNDIWMLESSIVNYKAKIECLQNVETVAVSAHSPQAQNFQGQVSRVLERLKAVLDLLKEKGLAALEVEIPHSAYSLAAHRRVKEPMDRIYGIMQTYGISCSLNPPGKDNDAKLCALEDELGSKLVSKSPIVSQLFVHSELSGCPRRSWLITQGCMAEDPFWETFSSKHTTRKLFDKFEVSRPDQDLTLTFKGKAWDLNAFVEASSPSSTLNTHESKNDLFRLKPQELHERYIGLLLDYHVSNAVLGRGTEYFQTHESMFHAVKLLQDYYCNVKMAPGSPALQVALLGSGAHVPNLPIVRYVGLVLALSPSTPGASSEIVVQSKGEQESCNGNSISYSRIGLMRWIENYKDTDERSPHYHLPLHHNLECIID